MSYQNKCILTVEKYVSLEQVHVVFDKNYIEIIRWL
jgi:hypothetical protein